MIKHVSWILHKRSQGVLNYFVGMAAYPLIYEPLLFLMRWWKKKMRCFKQPWPTRQIMFFLQILFCLHNCCGVLHVCSITLERKQSRRSHGFTELQKLFVYTVLVLQRCSVNNENRLKVVFWKTAGCGVALTQFFTRQYSPKYNFEVTLDNLSPAQMTLSLGESICMELALIFWAPEAAKTMIFFK